MIQQYSCTSKSGDGKETMFTLKEHTGIDFTNTVRNTEDFNIFNYRNFYNGGGVAVGDINNDGLPDIFFTANMGSNKLYLNKGNWEFDDITSKAGVEEEQKWSTGVVMADINGDGWLDIYVCNAGYIRGVDRRNTLYINNHDLTFTESAAAYGLDDNGYTTHAAFFDYDLDGDLDCYILNNSFVPVNTLNYANKRDLRAHDWPVADFLKGGGDKLLRNDGGHFTDVSEQAHIYGSLIGFGLGVTVGDINGDHYPDIYVSNDFFERDYLYINQRDGTFREDLENRIQHTSHSSMGADMTDINNDGYPDIFVTEMLPDDETRLKTTTSFESIDVQRLKQKNGFYNQFMQNTMQVNNQDGRFLETAFYSGVAASDWTWGALMFDADNDGLNDIYLCNGIYKDVVDQDFIDFFADNVVQKMALTGKKEEIEAVIDKMPSVPIRNKMFHNTGDLKFSEVGNEWGFNQPSFSNGAAYADLDNDGDLDIVINNVNEKAFVYQNNARELNHNDYIGLHLKGTGENKFAIGSTVHIYTRDRGIITRELIPSRGFQSSVEYKILAGLGPQSQVDSLVVIWPDNRLTRVKTPPINRVDTLDQSTARDEFSPPPVLKTSTFLKTLTIDFEKHREDDFVDFYTERNIPAMLSREGPHAAVGDVNGDGLEDVYVGGASGQSGQLYLQTRTGFAKKEEPAFDASAASEDVAVLFFDCDGDGDLDLFVGSGGNNAPARGTQMQDRLYKNDGKGNFTYFDAFPPNGLNTSIAVARDFDGDGDLDLFVGSRSVPYGYGLTPQNFVYINDGKGHFDDEGKVKSPALSDMGMVTDATFADLTGDGKGELIVVGDYTSPRIFQFQGDRFREMHSDLDSLFGMWRSVTAADLDGDGDMDLVFGNIGENFYLRPNQSNPVKMWLYDFDDNGVTDKIITRRIHGKDMPVFMKRDITDQLPILKKQNLKHKDYATKSVQDIIPADKLDKALVRTFNYPASCVAYNEGNGKFTVVDLPYQSQLSNINKILCVDVNGDGLPDLVTGGNSFCLLPQFCRLDASYGDILLNKGGRIFSELRTKETGLALWGAIQDIQPLVFRNHDCLLYLQNNEKPVLYQIDPKRSLASKAK